MGRRSLARAVLTVSVSMALGAVSAGAQVVTFSTSGALTGPNCVANICSVAGPAAFVFSLTYLNAASTSYLAPTLVDLGQFSTEFIPERFNFNSGGATFPTLSFTLTINQTA